MWQTEKLHRAFLSVLVVSMGCHIAAVGLPRDFSLCPAVCAGTSESWSAYSRTASLEECDHTMLLDFAIHNPLDDPATTVKIHACTVPDSHRAILGASQVPRHRYTSRASKNTTNSTKPTSLCFVSSTSTATPLEVSMAGDGSNFTYTTAAALVSISNYMGNSCNLKQTISFDTGSIVGVYAGAAIDNTASVPRLMAKTINLINGTDGAPETMFVQRCIKEGSSTHTIGIAINNGGDFSWVQQAIRTWSNGDCLSAISGSVQSTLDGTQVYEYTHPAITLPSLNSTSLNGTGNITANWTSPSAQSLSARFRSHVDALQPCHLPLEPETSKALDRRADCKTVKVVSEDSCGTLASKCGIRGTDFTKYNSGTRTYALPWQWDSKSAARQVHCLILHQSRTPTALVSP
jgi:hypothetical protein